jgi:transposase
MMKIDARKQTKDELYDRRRQAVRLHEQDVPVIQIVERTGLSWPTVNAAIKRFQAEGESALRPSARGRKQGTGRVLTVEQEAEIRDFMVKRQPMSYGLTKSLWDREAVQQLIAQKYGVKLSERVVGNYLGRWGLTLEKGKKRGYERCSKVIQQWLDANYAEILRQSREDDAEIYWLMTQKIIDAGLWCPERAPNVLLPATATPARSLRKLLMVAATNNQGKLRWTISNGRFNPDRQIKFVKALIRDTRRKKLVLIRSNRPHFGSPDFSHWLSKNTHRCKMFPEAKN